MTHRNLSASRLFTAATLVLGLAVSASALAGNEDKSSSKSASQQEKKDQGEQVTDAQLKKFAQAYGEIRTVRAQYQQKIQQAEGKQKKQELKKKGRQEMMGAIQEAGLDVSEYQRIGKQLNQSQELQKRLQKTMAQSSGSGSDSGSGSGSGDSGSGSN